MYDIKQVKHMIEHGGIAVNEKLQERIMNDQMTEDDHAFVSRVYETMRGVTKHGIDGYKAVNGFAE